MILTHFSLVLFTVLFWTGLEVKKRSFWNRFWHGPGFLFAESSFKIFHLNMPIHVANDHIRLRERVAVIRKLNWVICRYRHLRLLTPQWSFWYIGNYVTNDRSFLSLGSFKLSLELLLLIKSPFGVWIDDRFDFLTFFNISILLFFEYVV